MKTISMNNLPGKTAGQVCRFINTTIFMNNRAAESIKFYKKFRMALFAFFIHYFKDIGRDSSILFHAS